MLSNLTHLQKCNFNRMFDSIFSRQKTRSNTHKRHLIFTVCLNKAHSNSLSNAIAFLWAISFYFNLLCKIGMHVWSLYGILLLMSLPLWLQDLTQYRPEAVRIYHDLNPFWHTPSYVCITWIKVGQRFKTFICKSTKSNIMTSKCNNCFWNCIPSLSEKMVK